MGIEQTPTFEDKTGKENDGLILENGIWRKRTKEEDIELTENENIEKKETDKDEAGKENDGLVLINGIWRKRTKEEDIELTENENIGEKEEKSEELQQTPEQLADNKSKQSLNILERNLGHIPELGEATEQSPIYRITQGKSFLYVNLHSTEYDKKNNSDYEKLQPIIKNLYQEGEKARYYHNKQEIKNNLENIGLKHTFDQYKIHLQVKKEELPVVIDKLSNLVQQDQSLKDALLGFKINLSKKPERQDWEPKTGHRKIEYIPEIVIYPNLEKNNFEAALKKLMDNFSEEEVLKYGSGLPPRANFKVNNLIYFSQGDEYLKELLSWAWDYQLITNEKDVLDMPYVLKEKSESFEPYGTNLLEDYFDENSNFALLKGEKPPQFVKDYLENKLKQKEGPEEKIEGLETDKTEDKTKDKEPKKKKEKTGKKKDKQPKKKEEKLKEQKEESPEKQLDAIIKEIGEGNIPLNKLINFLSIPGAGEAISTFINNQGFQEEMKKPEAQEKIKKIIDKFQKFISKEKKVPKPEAVTKAKGFIKGQVKTEKEQKKESPWKTGGAIVFFLVLFMLLESISIGLDYLTKVRLDVKKK